MRGPGAASRGPCPGRGTVVLEEGDSIAFPSIGVSGTVAAGGIVFEALMGLDFWTGALIVVVVTGIYTVLGGLRAVLYTDLLQLFVLILGSVAITLAGLAELGGWGEMTRLAPARSIFLVAWPSEARARM